MKPSFFLGGAVSPLMISGVLSLGLSPANALTLTSSSGTWSNVVGATSTVVSQTIGNQNQVRWGEPGFIGSTIDDKSGLGFSGVASSSFAVGAPFAVGTLSHFNKVLTLIPGEVATGADLTVSLAFSDPAINPTFNFNFSISETVNAGPCTIGVPPCPDLISFSNAFASDTFTVDSVDYTLELLGFRTATGEILSQFISEESGSVNSATLFARITTPPPPAAGVPEPSAVLALSLLGLYAAFRQRSPEAR